MLINSNLKQLTQGSVLLLGLILLVVAFTEQVQAAEPNRVVYHAQMRLLHKGYKPGPIVGHQQPG